jgi:hypothetical protein
MTPRIPETFMENEDTTIHRICVAPNISSCLKGVRGMYPSEQVEVQYRHKLPEGEDIFASPIYTHGFGVYTVNAEPMPPMGVPDAERTGELWLTRPITFDKVGEIMKTERWKPTDTKILQVLWTWSVKL